MRINLDKMDTYKFVVCVLVFVLLFTLIFTMQMKSVINMQNKLLTKYLEDERPKTTVTSTYTPSKYTPATQKEIEKYSNYDY